MDIYDDFIKDLQSFNPDMSEYPRVYSPWLSIHKYRYQSTEWNGTETEANRRQKISDTLKAKGIKPVSQYGASNHKARSVQCIQTGKVYGSLIECAKDNNVSVRTIQNWCKKKAQSSTNGKWKGLSFRYLD